MTSSSTGVIGTAITLSNVRGGVAAVAVIAFFNTKSKKPVTAGLSDLVKKKRGQEKRDQMFLQLTYKAYTVFCFSVPLSYVPGQGALGGNVPRSMHLLLCEARGLASLKKILGKNSFFYSYCKAR